MLSLSMNREVFSKVLKLVFVSELDMNHFVRATIFYFFDFQSSKFGNLNEKKSVIP